MFNFRNNKLGMTLIEMIISLVVLGILTTSTMGIIISSNNIFISTSTAALDRQVGGYVFETLSSILKYSTHMSIYDADSAPANNKSQSVSIQVTDGDTNSGKLMYKGKDDSEPISLYDNGFYGNRTIQYSLKQEGSSGKHIKLTVTVYRDGKKRYELSRIIKCVNLALISVGEDANFIKDTSSADGYNQFVAFSLDEQLISGGKNAYSLEYKIAEYMAKYNRIQKEYSSKLLNVYGEVNEVLGKTENAEGKRVSESTYNTVVAMRNKAVVSSGTPVWEDTDASPYNYNNLRKHYQDEIKDLLKFTPTAGITIDTATNPYYGVVATKEELYAGFLLTYYDTNKDGKVDKSEFPQFSDPDTFFAGTSIANYVSNTNTNQMVILSYFKENTGEDYNILYSKKDKTVFTYSGTKESGYSNSVWFSTANGPGYDKGEILHDTDFAALNETRPAEGSMNADCHGKDPNVVQTYFSVYTGMYAAGRYFYHEKVSAANNVGGMPAYEYKGWGATASYNNTRGEDVVSSLLNNYKPTQLNGSNCSTYSSSADSGTIYIYPTVDLTQGWYYLKDGDKYYFIYLSAAQSESSKENNPGNIAVKGNAYSTVGGSGSKSHGRIVLGNTDDRTSFSGWAYAQAQYAQMEQGASDAKKATIDTVGCHQYTDYILYGVDWNSWFLKNPSNGLLNKIMTGAVTIVDTVIGGITGNRSFNKQDVQAISGSNAVLSLGNHGQMTVESTSTTVASYNMAWVVYSPKRGTWYYLPQASTRLSNATSKISWTSRKDQPMPLDVDIKNGKTWASSAAMVSDIDMRKMSSSGLFGLVDTTKDVLWVGLPTGNQVSVTF